MTLEIHEKCDDYSYTTYIKPVPYGLQGIYDKR
jgi:hypothetical protein